MATTKAGAKTAGIGDDAVKRATGRRWGEWLIVLDRAGARHMSHREIALHLHQREKLSGWWAQMVTVGYEQARGLRVAHEKPGGFEISKSKTLQAPVSRVFAAFKDPARRKTWLSNGPLVIRTATANKSLRFTWTDRKTILSVNLYARPPRKCQVTVQHAKLSDARSAEAMKKYWGAALERLKSHLKA